ncbi:hypothetical protein BuS5_01852 [Desulfosarcina sp. BuS5]|nr:hypothetical protein BuS5_01852 [Desulfosarcina sp. BuS5]
MELAGVFIITFIVLMLIVLIIRVTKFVLKVGVAASFIALILFLIFKFFT